MRAPHLLAIVLPLLSGCVDPLTSHDPMTAPGDGGASPAACGQPGDPGNSRGVGKYCTKGGGQCPILSFARFCTVDFEAGVPSFCTNACEHDSDCGEDAVCASSEPGGPKGCTPTACTVSPAQPDAGLPPATTDAGHPAVDAGTAWACGQPGDLGNDKGVGRYCTSNADCANNGSFTYCAAVYDSSAPHICTGPCSSSAECGTNATCEGSGLERGCVPAACVAPQGDGGSPPSDGGFGPTDGGSADCTDLEQCCKSPQLDDWMVGMCELTVASGDSTMCAIALGGYIAGGQCKP